MTYLTAELEAVQLRKMSDKSIYEEISFIFLQVQNRYYQIRTTMKEQAYGVDIYDERTYVPVWKLIEDIQNLNDQFQRINDELQRRRI